MQTIAVLGAGSWGTALSVHLARVGHDVRLWARDEALADEMTACRANAVYLPDITKRRDLEIIGEARPLGFDAAGQIIPIGH